MFKYLYQEDPRYVFQISTIHTLLVFIIGMHFRLMQTRFSQTHSRLTINFFYSVCIFIFKNITLDQDNSIGSLCKTLGSVQCKSRMFHYWLSYASFLTCPLFITSTQRLP